MTEREATPAEEVTVPGRFVTVPVPEVLAKVTERFGLGTLFPAASRISAVRVRALPEARFEVALVKTSFTAGPGTTVNVVEPEVRPPAEAVTVIDPAF